MKEIIKSLSKEALILGGCATAGIAGGLLCLNRKQIKKENEKIRKAEKEQKPEEINFDDLNKKFEQDCDMVIDDSDIDIGL